MTYAKPALAPLDLTTSVAICCRITIRTGDNTRSIGPLICPFPIEGEACTVMPGTIDVDAQVCVSST